MVARLRYFGFHRVLWVGIMTVSLFFMSSCKKDDDASGSVASSSDLLTHPIYSQYQFSDKESIIRLGTQPLYFPTGLITEMMKRDTILQSELSKLGKTIEYYPFLKGNDVNFFIKQGKLDAGIGGDMPTISIAAEKEMIIPSLIQHGFTSIVAKEPMQVSDLKGCNIGFAFGSNAHFALLSSLESNGLKEEDVNLISMDISHMPQALLSGQIDAFSGWEPTPTITLELQASAVIVQKNLSTGYLYFTKTFADNNSDVVSIIVAAEIRVLKWLAQRDQNILLAEDMNHKSQGNLQSNEHSRITVDRVLIELANNDIIGLNSPPIVSEVLVKAGGPLYDEFKFLQQLNEKWQSKKWSDIEKQFDRKIIFDILNRAGHYRINEFDYDINE